MGVGGAGFERLKAEFRGMDAVWVLGDDICVGGGAGGGAWVVGEVKPEKSSSKRSCDADGLGGAAGAGAVVAAKLKLRPLEGARTGAGCCGAFVGTGGLGAESKNPVPLREGEVTCAAAGVDLAETGLLKAPKSPKVGGEDGFGWEVVGAVMVLELAKFIPPNASVNPPNASCCTEGDVVATFDGCLPCEGC